MPEKRNKEKLVAVTVRVTQQQARDLDEIVNRSRIGSSRPEILKYFLAREIERLETEGKLKPPSEA